MLVLSLELEFLLLIENAIFQLPEEMGHVEGSIAVDVRFQLS